MKHLLAITAILIYAISNINAQSISDSSWKQANSNDIASSSHMMVKSLPSTFDAFQLDNDVMMMALSDVTSVDRNSESGTMISIPSVNQGFEEFEIFENQVVHPSVAHQYTIKTFEGQSTTRSNVTIRCDVSESGFHALIFDTDGIHIIEPLYNDRNDIYIAYTKDELDIEKIACGADHNSKRIDPNTASVRSGSSLRTYKIAFTPSGEYSQQHGSTGVTTCNKTNVLNSLATGLNMMNPIFKRDLGINFTLVTTEDLVFCDPATDPFDVYDPNQSIPQNQIEIDNIIGSANYDIGHLLAWDNIGGAAFLGVVCFNSHKAYGFSGSDASMSSLFIDYAAHEIGHQLNADHNFVSNECQTSATNLRFEPGEGSSIMSYAGVCGSGYQNNSDPYFHSASIEVMNTFIGAAGSTCGTTSGTGNPDDPSANAHNDITIPKETPYVLVASATDTNDPASSLTYVWEQHDGTSIAVDGSPNCNSTTAPLVKYVDPSTDPTRVIPEMEQILSGNNNGADWEKLSCVTRTMNFKVAVRDNNINWGRTHTDAMTVTVNATAGPFLVDQPNGGESYPANSPQTITWDVNNTNIINSKVDILITTDDGNTSTVLVMNVDNDGSQIVTMPNIMTSSARIVIQGSVGGNFKSASTFFDISDADFSLAVTLPLELLSFSGKVDTDGNTLSWQTANEINTKEFDIERSLYGTDFETLGTINSSGEHINKTNTYSFIDAESTALTVYYRLKQIDNDGSYIYSKVISLSSKREVTKVKIYPNPSNDVISLIGIEDKEILKLTITDAKGKQLIQRTLETVKDIEISSLASGVYFLTVDINGQKITHRFVKL